MPHDSELASLCVTSDNETWKSHEKSKTLITGLSREFILREAHKAREENSYVFEGFSDWSAVELSNKTGLTHDAADLAKQRHVTEPIIWSDTEERWGDFQKPRNQGLCFGR